MFFTLERVRMLFWATKTVIDPNLASVLLAFFVSRAYHVFRDLFGRVSHVLALLVGYDGHVDFLQDVGRLFALAQPAPSDHGALDALVADFICVRKNYLLTGG